VRGWSGAEPPLTMQALVALAAHDTAAARRIAARFPPSDTSRLITPPGFDDPIGRAAVLAAVGQKRAAVAVLETLDPARFNVLENDPRWAMYSRSLLERGALYEQLGDKARAAAAYQAYVDLMRDADPTLQPQVQLARARLHALRDAPAATLTPRPSR
jgi:hypothetical protein